MAIYKRGDVYWYEFEFKGRRVRESTHQGNQNLAKTMESARRTQLAKGEVGLIDKEPAPTLKEFAPLFMKQIAMDCASKTATITFYQSKTDLLLTGKLVDLRLDAIDESAIETYKRTRSQSVSRHKKPLSPASVNRELATLRRLLRMAHNWKLIDRLPKIKLLRGEGAREFVLSREMEPKYFDALTAPMRELAVFLIDTGLRVGEALKLEWSNVNVREEPGYLRVRALHSKNSRPRAVPMTPRIRKALKAMRRRSGLVFRSPDGGPLSHTWLDQQHAAVRVALGLPADFVLHSLRHTFGTRLGRDRSGRVYYHEAHGAFDGDGFPEIRASQQRIDEAGNRAAFGGPHKIPHSVTAREEETS